MISYLPIKFDRQTLSSYVSLFSQCFPSSRKYNIEYLDWLYCQNPEGMAVGFDAWDGDKLAAHYATIPTQVSFQGRVVKMLLSLNTATHPSYQGKGLFTKLADTTYCWASDNGYESVYGVANANSTPGFVRKLGFDLIEPLKAKVGFGSLAIDFELLNRNMQFQRIWTSDGVDWRCANPYNRIFSSRQTNVINFHAKAIAGILPAYAEISMSQFTDHDISTTNDSASLCRLFIGLLPEGASQLRRYYEIPQRLRPSPLNLIHRSLTKRTKRLERNSVNFSFMDFDAY